MNLLLTIKNSENKLGVKKFIQEKATRLNKYFSNKINISWKNFTENGLHFSEVKISGFAGSDIKTKVNSRNEYESISLAVLKLEKQLQKRQALQKGRFTNELKERIHLEN
jgi:ribosomal subunit interface protein